MKKWLVASYLLWLVGVGFTNVRTYVHPETQEEVIVKIEYIGTNDDNEDETYSIGYLEKTFVGFLKIPVEYFHKLL